MDKAWKFLALAACLGTLCAARPSTKHVGRPHQDSTKADYAKRMKAAAAPVVVPPSAKNAEVDPVSDSAKAAAALAAAVRRANFHRSFLLSDPDRTAGSRRSFGSGFPGRALHGGFPVEKRNHRKPGRR